MKSHPHAAKFLDPERPEFSEEDFYLSLDLDRFDFFPIVIGNKIVRHEPPK